MKYVRVAKEEEKEAVRALWSSCFHDSKSYMDLWFSENYPKGKILVAVDEEETLLGALQMYRVSFREDEAMRVGYYIGGVSVWEEHRHKKIGSLLMEKAEKVAREDGMDFCILVADVVGYYERFGYLPRDHRINLKAIPTVDKVTYREADARDGRILLGIYNAFVSEKCAYQLRTAEDMTGMVLQEGASAGRVVILGEENSYVAYDTTEDTLYVDEVAWASGEGKDAAITLIHNFGKENISLRAGSSFKMTDGNPSVMVLPLKGNFPKSGYFNVIV